jgi:hypothetical protein
MDQSQSGEKRHDDVESIRTGHDAYPRVTGSLLDHEHVVGTGFLSHRGGNADLHVILIPLRTNWTALGGPFFARQLSSTQRFFVSCVV